MKRNQIKIKIGVIIFAFMFILTGCSSDQGRKPMQKWVIGFSQCTMIDEWRATMVEEMEREIERLTGNETGKNK